MCYIFERIKKIYGDGSVCDLRLCQNVYLTLFTAPVRYRLFTQDEPMNFAPS